ncbi:MerR family transcriptional regulator [Aquabacterium sp.]|jgi:DNA-binding transcriptional MerR regulator|uniref:MerR family transcriptional regulator n=1 Tax=Aquabacterium sp. TaxID=1872578 RepID=UPI0025C4188F|nr:MerR family transcriptional regulator [Aquabacterium sp.]
MDRIDSALPPIPAKRYFTIGEVSELCLVKPYVLRYWEQEFVQLKPMKRRGNRRYYQHHEVLLIRRIRELLYEQGFTISGARNQLAEAGVAVQVSDEVEGLDDGEALETPWSAPVMPPQPSGESRVVRALQASAPAVADALWIGPTQIDLQDLDPEAVLALREALVSIRDLLV